MQLVVVMAVKKAVSAATITFTAISMNPFSKGARITAGSFDAF